MHYVVRHDPLHLVIRGTSGIEVSVEPREIAAGYFHPNAVPRREVVAGSHRLQSHLVHLALLHPYWRLLISFAIADSLNGLVEVISRSVRVDVDHLHREVRVLGVRRYVERRFHRAAYFEPFPQRLGGVNQNIRPRLHLALIECAAR